MATFTASKTSLGVTVKAVVTYSVSSTATQTTLTVSSIAISQAKTASAIAGITGVSLSGAVTYSKTYSSVTGDNRTEKPNKTVTWSKATSGQSKTLSVKLDFVLSGQESATASTTITVPAMASYAVKYAANGGSSTPAAQTKYYGRSLTLAAAISHANTSPGSYTVTRKANYTGGTDPSALSSTRTVAYSFSKWKSSTDSKLYAAGASYTANAATTMTAQWTTSETRASVSLGTMSRSGYSFKRWNTAADDSGTGYTGSYTPNGNVTLYAIWNRTVTYNANGGSGAPSAQTAVATSAITLSTTKPTFSGYTFKRWNTEADDSGVAYASGGSYGANMPSDTLYAIWNRTVTYNANGGTGAPSAQTGVRTAALKLSTTVPKKTGYAFAGWATSSSATTAAYQAGGTYAANNPSVKLYAVWTKVIESVVIGSAKAVRVASSGSTTATDDGTVAYIRVPFTVKGTASASVSMTMTATSSGGTAPTVTYGTRTATKPDSEADLSGTFTAWAATCGVDDTCTFAVTVTAGGKSAARNVVLSAAHYTMDVLAGGRGVAFGKAATKTGVLDIGYAVETEGNVTIEKALPYLMMKDNALDTRLGQVGAPNYTGRWYAYDANDKPCFYTETTLLESGQLQRSFVCRRYSADGETEYNNGFYLRIDGSGNPNVIFTTGGAAAWRSGLGLDRSATVTTISQVITAASGITINSVSYTERAGIAHLNVSAKGFAASTGSQAVGTVVSGKRPAFIRYESVTTSYAVYCSLTSAGALSVYWGTAPSPSTNYTMSLVYPLA